MATYHAVLGVLQALKGRLDEGMSTMMAGEPKSAVILGSQTLATGPASEQLAIYLHRISVDPVGRNRYLRAGEDGRAPQPELPVNLHILLIGWSTKHESEVDQLAAAMQVIGSALVLDPSSMALSDAAWGLSDVVQVMPEEMSTEDLMRLWDSLPGDYRLSAPYLIKNLRLQPFPLIKDGPLVDTVATKIEVLEGRPR